MQFRLGLASVLTALVFGLGAADARPQFSAITVDARTGQVLYSDQADGSRHPASLTKMMTLYVLFQDLKSGKINRSTRFVVSGRAASMAPSKLGLRQGTTITVDDAIKALVTKSANDVAATIAENLGGSESDFAARMTRVARSIGMTHSTFRNASGLPSPDQFTTARDMATLGLRLMRDFPQYYPYFRITAFNFHGRLIRTHNRLVEHYAGTDGIKTGYIADAGYNLVTSTRRGEKRLVGVVLGARSGGSRSAFMMSMFEKMFPRAKGGGTVAALAGSSAGVINPLAAKSGTATASAKPVDESNVASAELASAAADAASGEIEATSGDEDGADAVDGTASTTGPKVLQASLDPIAKKPGKLPFSVVSTSDMPGTLDSAMSGSWNIQIGAYPSKAKARAKISVLRGKFSETLLGKEAFTEVVTKGSRTIYRARFSGFDADGSKQICAEIEKKIGVSCRAIAPQS